MLKKLFLIILAFCFLFSTTATNVLSYQSQQAGNSVSRVNESIDSDEILELLMAHFYGGIELTEEELQEIKTITLQRIEESFLLTEDVMPQQRGCSIYITLTWIGLILTFATNFIFPPAGTGTVLLSLYFLCLLGII